MALPATDAFTGSGGATTLVLYSANWTMNNGAIQASRGSTDNFYSNANSDNGAHWNADAFGNDQYSQITLSGVLGTHWAGAAARAHASAVTWYAFFTDGTGAGTEVYKIVGGTYTTLGSTGTQAWSLNDTLRLEVVGTTLTPKRNGSVYSSIGAQTDAAISSGSAGIVGYGLSGTSNTCGDNWEGGNLGGATTKVKDLIESTGVIARKR